MSIPQEQHVDSTEGGPKQFPALRPAALGVHWLTDMAFAVRRTAVDREYDADAADSMAGSQVTVSFSWI